MAGSCSHDEADARRMIWVRWTMATVAVKFSGYQDMGGRVCFGARLWECRVTKRSVADVCHSSESLVGC